MAAINLAGGTYQPNQMAPNSLPDGAYQPNTCGRERPRTAGRDRSDAVVVQLQNFKSFSLGHEGVGGMAEVKRILQYEAVPANQGNGTRIVTKATVRVWVTLPA